MLREAVHILAEGMPEGIKASTVAETMGAVPGVAEVHDLHVWTVSPGYAAHRRTRRRRLALSARVAHSRSNE